MSLDLFGFPEQADPHGAKTPVLSGQHLVLFSQPLMPGFLRWTRATSLACVAGANVFLPFDVPALPVGSYIHAIVALTIGGGGDTIALVVSPDLLKSGPSADATLAGPSVSASGLNHMHVWVTSRNGSTAYSENSAGNNLTTNTNLDWFRVNRLAVVGNETTNLVILAATVEVFIPRVLR